MPLALASVSHYAINIMNGSNAFHSLRQLKWSATWLFWSWCHWYWHHCHMMQMISSMAPFHSLCQGNLSEVKHHLFGHLHHWHWCWCHMRPTVLSMTPLHSLGQDNWNEVKYDVFNHVIPLVLASTLCDANSIINSMIKMRCNMTFSGHVT